MSDKNKKKDKPFSERFKDFITMSDSEDEENNITEEDLKELDELIDEFEESMKKFLKKATVPALLIILLFAGIKIYKRPRYLAPQKTLLEILDDKNNREIEDEVQNEDSFDLGSLEVGIVNRNGRKSLNIVEANGHTRLELYDDKLPINIENKNNMGYLLDWYEFVEGDEAYETYNIESVKFAPLHILLTTDEMMDIANNNFMVTKSMLNKIFIRHRRNGLARMESILDIIADAEKSVIEEEKLYQEQESDKKGLYYNQQIY